MRVFFSGKIVAPKFSLQAQCEYCGTQYRVRLYPPFGYSILYKEYYLTGFNHQKSATHVAFLSLEFSLEGSGSLVIEIIVATVTILVVIVVVVKIQTLNPEP